MKYENIKSGIIITVLFLINSCAMAEIDIVYIEKNVETVEEKDASSPKMKRTLNSNMTLNYHVIPGSADNLSDLFSKGMLYGRLRSNSFYWHWNNTPPFSNDADKNMGVGGSLVYRSAVLHGFSFTAGYYGSFNPEFWRPDKDKAVFSKAGKDTFSRYKLIKTGHFGLDAWGQIFLEYNNNKVDVKVGRQLFESVFTKSNDTKMIPNSFDGISVSARIAPKTEARLAWFGAQKLRDHEDAHDVITFGDADGEYFNNNDDSGGHKGLSYDHFVKAGKDTDHDLRLADITSTYIQNLQFTGSYLQIPGVLKDFVIEAHYKIPLSDSGWAVRPGIRYFMQFDDGGGIVAGDSNALGKPLVGYDPSVNGSLDSSLFNARLDVLMPGKKGFFRLGYSKVADEADIIAPWRGFPTGGFTRVMAQYNWFSNTETFMLKAAYKFNPIWKASIGYAIQNFDDKKVVPSDSDVIHIDVWTDITKDLQMRMRYGYVWANDMTASPINPGAYKIDWSYNEFRLEFNYLF